MTNKEKCQHAARGLGVEVTLHRNGREVYVEAVTPCRLMFEMAGSHTLLTREFAGFRGTADRLWEDMRMRLASESLVPCPADCDCWDEEECCHG